MLVLPTPAVMHNWIDNEHVAVISSVSADPGNNNSYLSVTSPATGSIIAQCSLSSSQDVDLAVQSAHRAFLAWSSRTVKDRVQFLIRFHQLVVKHANEIADLIVLEHGKTKQEALAEISKGNETVEYALSMPQLMQGKNLEVSRGVVCNDTRRPLGVVVSIVPFNFPFMVPFWTIPIAIATGNTIVIKPSEKVPLTMNRVMAIFKEAGLPNGVVNLVNGTAEAVNALCDHPLVKAVTFVGTSRIGDLVAKRCRAANKRALSLGGAKNHLVASPDCDVEMTARDITSSFSGCAGQRCMAASVLLTIGEQPELVKRIVQIASEIKPGQDGVNVMGPVIDKTSHERIESYIAEADANACQILLDGRSWSKA